MSPGRKESEGGVAVPMSLGEMQAGPCGFGSPDPPSLNCDPFKGKNCALFLLFIYTHM